MLSEQLGVLVLGPLGRNSGAGQCQTLTVTGAGQPVWSYKVIHSLWLPLLGLGVYVERTKLHTKAVFHQHRT